MTDQQVWALQSNVGASFNNCVGGRIVWGERNLVYYRPDGHYGGFHQIGGGQKIANAYWDKMNGYTDIIHIKTVGGRDLYLANGGSGIL